MPGSHVKKKKILCIDDEFILAELCEERLMELGYEVVGETDPVKALRMFEENPHEFHLLIVDHLMPGILGLELAKKAKNIRHDIHVLLVTGHDGLVSEAKRKPQASRKFL